MNPNSGNNHNHNIHRKKKYPKFSHVEFNISQSPVKQGQDFRISLGGDIALCLQYSLYTPKPCQNCFYKLPPKVGAHFSTTTIAKHFILYIQTFTYSDLHVAKGCILFLCHCCVVAVFMKWICNCLYTKRQS
jgi:hypothetical protein